MSVKDIITVPDETLKKISEPIEKVGKNEIKLIKDLFQTMYQSNGIGLAAVQVGILKRILVVDVSSKDEKKKPLSFINPTIKKISNETSIYEEGCLSIPDTFIEIERPKICEVEYIDIDGKMKNLKCDGDYLVMVKDTVSCDSFNLTITNTSTETQEYYESEECTEDGSKPKGYEDDPAGWYDMGSTFWVSNGAHEINASHEIYLVPLWEVVGEELGEAVGGFLQGAAGFGAICCGGVLTIFGLILGLLVNNDQKTMIIQNGAMPGMMQQTNQTMMTQPTKSYADVPIQPQTTMQQGNTGNVWDQEQPKNPF